MRDIIARLGWWLYLWGRGMTEDEFFDAMWPVGGDDYEWMAWTEKEEGRW